MPNEKSQLYSHSELQSRQWIYLQDRMLWLKPKKEQYEGKGNKKSAKAKQGNTKSVIVFNPQLWKEEVVSLVED